MSKQKLSPTSCQSTGAILIGLTTIGLISGCGGRLVEPAPLQPTSVPPAAIPATPARNDFHELPRVPASSVLTPSTGGAKGVYYEVRSGDTLTNIAKLNGTTIERLLQSNGFDRETVLQPGQLVYIPEAK